MKLYLNNVQYNTARSGATDDHTVWLTGRYTDGFNVRFVDFEFGKDQNIPMSIEIEKVPVESMKKGTKITVNEEGGGVDLATLGKLVKYIVDRPDKPLDYLLGKIATKHALTIENIEEIKKQTKRTE